MAVAAEVQRRHKNAGGRASAQLHREMVERALHGFDVQLSAVHFAATSLAMLNPEIQFDRMNLYTMPLGTAGREVRLGSLEFLGASEAPVQGTLGNGEFGFESQDVGRVSGRGLKGAAQGATVKLPELNLAIMNPPFTRADKLMFGRLPQRERKAIRGELNDRIKGLSANATAGLGPPFIAAAAPKLRDGEGRLALVLPLTVCTGDSWRQTRALIEREFLLDTVVASHDPVRWNFSDSTDLSEALLIATRRPADGGAANHRTAFVNLWRNSEFVVDAHKLAQAITNAAAVELDRAGAATLFADGEAVGEAISIPAQQLRRNAWIGVQFARADLVRCAYRLLTDGVVRVPGRSEQGNIPLCRLGDLAALGPDRRDIMDGFDTTESVTAYETIEGTDTEKRTSLSTEPDHYLRALSAPRPGRRLKNPETLWSKAAALLIAERLWLNTARTTAMCATRPVLSNVYWEAQVASRAYEHALAVWLNSSLGILSLLASRTTTRGPWIALKKKDLEHMPILNVGDLTNEQRQQLAELFDEMADDVFAPLPEMADCPIRAKLDNGVSEILNLPDLSTLRRLLASEPTVSNQRL